MSSRFHANLSHLILIGLFAAGLLLVSHAGATDGQDEAWQAAIDPQLINNLDDPGLLEFLVILDDRADLSTAKDIRQKSAKGAYVVDQLRETATKSQKQLLADLAARDIQYQSFWIVNAVLVRARAETLISLASRPEISQILANSRVASYLPQPDQIATDPGSTQGVEWNIELIGAPELWAQSIDGRDVVIGGQDTGYEWDHPAIKDQYRGWDGKSVDHDYNWHDAIHAGSGPCGIDSPEPCDDNGHGTHTMGTMLGDDGGSNQIGVAPGARWIGCRNMNQGVGTPATYIECFQWFIAPTRVDGADPDPSKAPDVISNSWSCPTFEGCIDPDILRQAVEAVRAAGILTVQSAGNSGSSCSSISTPAAIYDASFTVGATNSADQIAGFSSRGPVDVDHSLRPKPDVVAPGVSVRSSYRGGYATLQGTSMAAPHVAGLVALLISASPDLAGDVDQLERAISASAVRKTTLQDCPGMPGDQIPNAAYGYGRIDAAAAVRFATGPRYWFPFFFSEGPVDLALDGNLHR